MTKPAEGVAAPLEPSAEQFYEANEVERFDKDFAVYPDGWFKFAEAYAAAVSKNLQEELADAHKWGRFKSGIIADLQDSVKCLNEEITALRETKL